MTIDYIEAPLGEIFDVVTGNTPSKKDEENYGRELPFVKPPDVDNKIILNASEFLSEKGKLKGRILPPQSTLITCIGNLGRVGLNKCEVAFNQQINALKPLPQIKPEFTFYQAQTTYFRQQLEEKSTSTTVALVNKSNFSTIKFRIAPLPIQRAIVAKIEELFSSLDSGIADLKKAQEQVKVYRQAVLKKAFEGVLTKEWRKSQRKLKTLEQLIEEIEQNLKEANRRNIIVWQKAVEKWKKDGEKGTKPGKPKPIKPLPPISEIDKENFSLKNVEPTRFGQFISSIEAGKSFRCEERPPTREEIGVAKVSAVSWSEYNETESKTCTDQKKINEAYFIKKGDFLMSRANTIELVGSCVIVKENQLKIMLSDKILRINFSYGIKSFFLYYLRSLQGRMEIEKNSTGNQESMRNIGQDRIKNILIPIFSMEEQVEIVKEIETRFDLCEKVEESIQNSILKGKAIRKSILKKAFEGELLSAEEIEKCKKEHDYEPADVLLQKIKAESL